LLILSYQRKSGRWGFADAVAMAMALNLIICFDSPAQQQTKQGK
jgi:hypothetical protein